MARLAVPRGHGDYGRGAAERGTQPEGGEERDGGYESSLRSRGG
jgi:hypothetical protein